MTWSPRWPSLRGGHDIASNGTSHWKLHGFLLALLSLWIVQSPWPFDCGGGICSFVFKLLAQCPTSSSILFIFCASSLMTIQARHSCQFIWAPWATLCWRHDNHMKLNEPNLMGSDKDSQGSVASMRHERRSESINTKKKKKINTDML